MQLRLLKFFILQSNRFVDSSDPVEGRRQKYYKGKDRFPCDGLPIR